MFNPGKKSKEGAYTRIKNERKIRHNLLIQRLREKAIQEGTESIWAEMLAEAEKNTGE